MEDPKMAEDRFNENKPPKSYSAGASRDGDQETGKGTQAYEVEAQEDVTVGKGVNAYEVEAARDEPSKGTHAYDVEAQRDEPGKGTQAYDVEGK